MIREDFTVQPIKKEECKPWLLDKHYAHRIPPIMYAYGLYDSNKQLQGCCIFGYPCRMLTEYWKNILELNRLVVNENLPRNVLSYLVSCSLKLLPSPNVIVSYADDNQGHHGYIYQATNWIYTGLSSSENKIFIEGNLVHRRTLNSVYKTSSVKDLQEKGYNIEVEEQVGKHRYFMFLGSKKQKKEMLSKLKYQILPYPKGDNTRYDASKEIITQGILF